MRSIANFAGYQAVWFIAVWSAAHGNAWPGVMAGAVFVSWQLLASGAPRADLRLLLLGIALGCLVDGVEANTGWAVYAAPAPAFPPHAAPVWILALWGSFSMTINHSLRYVRDHTRLAMLLGAVGAPLAYLGAEQGWRALVFQTPIWRGLCWLSGTWAIGMSLFVLLARHPTRSPARTA